MRNGRFRAAVREGKREILVLPQIGARRRTVGHSIVYDQAKIQVYRIVVHIKVYGLPAGIGRIEIPVRHKRVERAVRRFRFIHAGDNRRAPFRFADHAVQRHGGQAVYRVLAGRYGDGQPQAERERHQYRQCSFHVYSPFAHFTCFRYSSPCSAAACRQSARLCSR